jgi:trans-aconitate 2-methyltransferase
MNESTYTWDSTAYARHSAAQAEWAQELIAKLHLQGAEVVLDLGCGDGQMTLALAACVPAGTVVGIDNSESMITWAQRRLAESSCQHVQFTLMSATALTFDQQFDVVFSNAALHWTKQHLAVLTGIKKSLKPSGRILLQMGGKGNAQDLITILQRILTRARWHVYFHDFAFPYGFYGAEEYTAWLQQVGLHPTRVELIPKDMKQAGKEGLAGWLRTTWLPYTERIPEALRETFIAEIVDVYVDAFPPDHQGYIHVKMVRLEVEARNP